MRPTLDDFAILAVLILAILIAAAAWLCVPKLTWPMSAIAWLLTGAGMAQGIVGELTFVFEGETTLIQKIAMVVTEICLLTVLITGVAVGKETRSACDLSAELTGDEPT